MTILFPDNIYIHCEEGVFHFRSEREESGYCFIGLRRSEYRDETAFGLLSDSERRSGWRAFDEFMGRM